MTLPYHTNYTELANPICERSFFVHDTVGVVDHPATEMPEWTSGSTIDLTFRLRTANRRPCICSHHATFSLNNHDGSFCSIAILKNRFRRQLALSPVAWTILINLLALKQATAVGCPIQRISRQAPMVFNI
jgi:hypothetical protein